MTTTERRLRDQLRADGVDPDLVEEIVDSVMGAADDLECY
jgi:hypothetical protein